MGTIIVKQKAAGLIKKGSPLISQMDLAQELRADEGEVVKVLDQQRRFLGMAYVGFQIRELRGCIAARKTKRWMMRSLAASSRRHSRIAVHSSIRRIRRLSVSSTGKVTALAE